MAKRSSRARKPPVENPVSSTPAPPPPVVEKKKPPVKRPVIETISFPVSEKDEEIVECSICNAKSTFREFRIHNITAHYNIASTVGDPVERNYKFFVKQLQDMAKLMKISVFKCPVNCEAKYKSALGLAYHLENCGKTEAEKLATYVKCDFCEKSYPKTSITQHRLTHKRAIEAEEEEKEDEESDERGSDITEVSESKRRSALKAQQKIKKITVQTKSAPSTHGKSTAHESDEEFVIKEEFDDEDHDDKRKKSSKKAKKKSATATLERDDDDEEEEGQVSSIGDEEQNVWDKPERVLINFFPPTNFPVNPLQSFDNEDEARLYLPSVLNSIEFKVKTKERSTDFHHLSMFESELVDGESGNNVINVGGPVSSMSWHPSAKYLALSTLQDIKTKPNVLEHEENPTCIQLYKNSYYKPINDEEGEENEDAANFTGLDLELVLGIDNGFIHHLQWSSFWPSESEDFIGHLAYACGDSSVAISFVRKSYLDKEFNVSMDSSVNISSDLPRMIRLYKKVPEILLRLNDPYIQNSGQCVTFDWHESSEYLTAGYGKGLVAVYNLQATSKFLRKVKTNDENNTTELYPIWYIRAHTDVISSIQFNPANPRYFVTCSYDYYVKTWDLKLREEMESKKVGMVLAAVWIRGWVHLVLSSEILNANFQSSATNMVRFFQVGSAKNYISCAEQYNVTALDFFEGMTVLGSEVGRVSIVYYDQYLRECDYDRNRKKRNTVTFSKIMVEKNEDFDQDMETGGMGGRRLIFSLDNMRRESHQDAPEPTLQDMENYINSYYLIRINKVSWCPTGQQLATGYHNGFLLVTPTSFKDLFGVYVSRRR